MGIYCAFRHVNADKLLRRILVPLWNTLRQERANLGIDYEFIIPIWE